MNMNPFSDINKDHYYTLQYDRVDKLMLKILWWQSVALALYAIVLYVFNPARLYPGPFSWRVVTGTEVGAVVALGMLVAAIMTGLRGKFKNHYLYRVLMANAQFVFSYLIVFISGGSIEWHFHFFIMFALLVFYYDWKLGWWAIIAVALHHGILNYVRPGWVYEYGRNDLSFVAHALIVAIMAMVTTLLAQEGRRRAIAFAEANKILETKVRHTLSK